MIQLTVKTRLVIKVPNEYYPTKDVGKIKALETENFHAAMQQAVGSLSDNLFVTVEVDEV